MQKVEHLLRLSDEYQAKAVLDLCVKCLKDESKSKENALKILFLANGTVIAREDDRLDCVRKNCYDLIKNMELTDIMENNDFENLSNLDRDYFENVVVQRTERLETFLKEVYPQLIGLVEYALWACMDQTFSSITPCSEHFSDRKTNEDLFKRIKSCPFCRKMIEELVSSSKPVSHASTVSTSVIKPGSIGNRTGNVFAVSPGALSSSNHYSYGGSYHFDEKLVSIIQDFHNMLRL